MLWDPTEQSWELTLSPRPSGQCKEPTQHLGMWKCPVACRCTCPSSTTFCSSCSSCTRNPASHLQHHPLCPSSMALGIDGVGKASLAEVPGTLQPSHVSEGIPSFGYPNSKPLVAVFILQNWKAAVSFHASSLAPVTHCSILSAASAQ